MEVRCQGLLQNNNACFRERAVNCSLKSISGAVDFIDGRSDMSKHVCHHAASAPLAAIATAPRGAPPTTVGAAPSASLLSPGGVAAAIAA